MLRRRALHVAGPIRTATSRGAGQLGKIQRRAKWSQLLQPFRAGRGGDSNSHIVRASASPVVAKAHSVARLLLGSLSKPPRRGLYNTRLSCSSLRSAFALTARPRPHVAKHANAHSLASEHSTPHSARAPLLVAAKGDYRGICREIL